MIQDISYKYKFSILKWSYKVLLASILFCFLPFIANSQIIKLSPNATMTLSSGSKLTVNGSIQFNTNSTLTQNGYGEIYIGKDWENNGGLFNAGSGKVFFFSTISGQLFGTSNVRFNLLEINKTNSPNDIFSINQDFYVIDSLIISDGILRFQNTAARNVTLEENIYVLVDGTFDIASGLSVEHTISMDGSIFNSGILDFYDDANSFVTVDFTGADTSFISGNGLTTRMGGIDVSKDAANVEVYPTADNFDAMDAFLKLNTGTFHFASTYTFSRELFREHATTLIHVPSTSVLWFENPNVNIVGQTGNTVFAGLIQIDNGKFNTIGNLLYDDDGEFIQNADTVNIGTAFGPENNRDDVSFTLTDGLFRVGNSAQASSTIAMFEISTKFSTFNWSGGIIELSRNNNNIAHTNGDYFIDAENGSITAGELRINSALSADAEFEINTSRPVYDFLMTGTNDPVAKLIVNDFEVLNDITIDGTGAGRFVANNFDIYLSGDWYNNSPTPLTAFDGSSSRVEFNASVDQHIDGTQSTSFHILRLNKNGGDLVLNTADTKILNEIRLYPNSPNTALVDLNQNKLIIGESGTIVSNSGSNRIDFDTTKMILNSESAGNYAGLLEKETTAGTTGLVELMFPVGTSGIYSPAEIQYRNNQVTYASGARTAIGPVPLEHPMVEENNVSLTKYWKVETENITLDPDPQGDANIYFYYDDSELQGNYTQYKVLFYTPPYPDPSAYWRVDPGEAGNLFDYNNRIFYSVYTHSLDGDWTAGEDQAARATYYTRADGSYKDPNTWSTVNFGGPAATTAPNKRSDRVFIGNNNTVTVDSAVAAVGYMEVQANSTLRIAGDYEFTGDTIKVLDDSYLHIGHTEGVYTSPTTKGCFQTDARVLSSNVVYTFIDCDSTMQETGDGFPTPVRSVVVNKSFADTLKLTQYFEISDSLVINEGSLDINTFYINGYTTDRLFWMRGGELIVRNAYPTNYLPNTFTVGRITFDGVDNTTIPSSGSTPSVNQYNNLKIAGDRTGTVTLSSLGNIDILDTFDIESLNFAGVPSKRFLTDGSTIRFVKTGGPQNIPCLPGNAADSLFHLEYYNLYINGDSTKSLYSHNGTPTFVVLNDIYLSSSTLISNGFNLKVNGDWLNLGGKFNPGTDAVIMNSPTLTFTNTITVRDTSENPFYNLSISGEGIVESLDDLLVNGDLFIMNTANFKIDSTSLTLLGNWTNNGNPFIYGTSKVYLEGSLTQVMSKNSDNESFFDLLINNSSNIDATGVGTTSDNGVIINNDLTLTSGNLRTRGRHATVYGSLSRPGATPGHIDGALRKVADTATVSYIYEVGYETSYTPVILDISGTGGDSGLLSVLSDTITGSSSPVTIGLNPSGSNMDDDKNIRRQYTVSIPSSSLFTLGTDRTYDITMQFIKGNNPAGDIRNSADYNLFDARLWNLASWIAPNRFGQPTMGARTDSSTQYRFLEEFGTVIIGEPSQNVFYSIADGNWGTASSWSTQSYGGAPSAVAPTDSAIVYIGDSITITMEANKISNGVVTLDSTGTLLCEDKILGGTGSNGEFRISAGSVLGIGHSAGILDAGTNDGNIQTQTRNYNFGNHYRAHFIYTQAAAQSTGTGLPDSVATLTIDKSANSATLTQNVVVKDSLHLKNGSFSGSNNDITVLQTTRIDSTASFIPNTSNFIFAGTENQNFYAENDLTFYNLIANNQGSNNSIKFNNASSSSHNIQINNSLVFETNNLAYIDLSTVVDDITLLPEYNNGEWFMTIDQASSGVSRLGLGHIEGELRKWVPTNSLSGAGITWEVGSGDQYTPFTLDLSGSGGGEQAGYIGMHQINYRHPHSHELAIPSYYYPQERIIHRYWRMTRPAISSFARGSREMSFTANYLDPDDIPDGALKLCFDIVYWRGGLTSNWQRLAPPDNRFNDASTSRCGDRDNNQGEAEYRPLGTTTSTTAYDISTTITFADSDLGLTDNNRFLKGDFIVAQQGPNITYYYSKNDGDWTDPNTWVTDSYASTTNSTGSYPKRRLDAAVIGEGVKVTLDANIGAGYPAVSGTDDFHEQRLGSVRVEETTGGQGHLDLGTFVIRASVGELHSGGIMETGCIDGFPTELDRGNLQRQYSGNQISRNLNYDNHNNGNLIFSTEGRISETWRNADLRYCDPRGGWDNNYGYLDDVEVSAGATYAAPNIFESLNTGRNGRGTAATTSQAFRYFCDRTMTVTQGQTYTMRVTPAGTANPQNYGIRVWIDTDYDGTYDDPGERFTSTYSSGQYYITFQIPTNTDQGTTQMRVQMRYNGGQSPCYSGSSYGEVEDYTVYINNTGRTYAQQTGGDVPDTLSSITINPDRTNSVVNLSQTALVKDTFQIDNGTFYPLNDTINLQGDFVNNSNPLAYSLGTSGLIMFSGDQSQLITGTDSTNFHDISLNKTGGEITLENPTRITNQLHFETDSYLDLGTSHLYLSESAPLITTSTGSFDNNRMIRSNGLTSSGNILKEFSTTAGSKFYLFPIGIDTIYGGVSLDLTATSYTATPTIEIKLVGEMHPDRPGNNMLEKYWSVQSYGIAGIVANSIRFNYDNSEVNGEHSRYIPALWLTGPSEWEINLGTAPKAVPSPIEITNVLNQVGIDGDWTAGDALDFFSGRIYYSIATGTWDTPNRWSTESHVGMPASYYPGQLFVKDTAIIDAYEISFNLDSVTVDTVRVGGPFSLGANVEGVLRFTDDYLNKKLIITNNFGVMEDGIFQGDSVTAGRQDTLILKGNFYNYALAAQNGGVYLYSGNDYYTVMKFNGSGSVAIDGEGVWGSLAEMILEKDNQLNDTLTINSATFSNATMSSPFLYRYYPEMGVLKHNVNAPMSISNGQYEINMQPYTAFAIFNGSVNARASVYTNVNTNVYLNGGNFNIGDAIDENFEYHSGTNVDILSGYMDVSSCFIKKDISSTLNFTMQSNGTVRVMKNGNSDASNIGFDVSLSSSSFSMDGGRIIIAGGSGSSTPDCKIDATNGTGMSAGTIQVGDSNTPNDAIIKISGKMPIWDIHSVGNASGNVTTQIVEETYTVKNDIIINNLNTFEARGNAILLSGDLLNSGVYDATTGSNPLSQRILVLNGPANEQVLFNNQAAGLELYNLRVTKPNGKVTLGQSVGDNSNLIVRNTIEFTSSNTASIDSRSNQVYVESSPSGGSSPTILRVGQGHINGRLYRHVDVGNQSSLFYVGGDSAGSYRPMRFEPIGPGGTAGLVGVILNEIEHPDLLNADLNDTNNVEVYWNLSTNGFDLGTRTFNITTYFKNPEDITNPSDTLFYEHYLYTPPCPDPPNACPGGGTWTELITTTRAFDYISSELNTQFGDIVIAEPDGQRFYSIADGDWDDPDNWSTVSYESTVNTVARYPGGGIYTSDKAYIGNGKEITVPDGLSPEVHTLQIEMYNDLPGTLQIDGNLGFVRGNLFVLEDSCNIGVMNINGLRANAASGAVIMNTRNYGISNYLYNTLHGTQNSGDGMPDSVMSVTLDNLSSPNNDLFLFFNAGIPALKIADSLTLINGQMHGSNRDIILWGDLKMYNNSSFRPYNAYFEFANPDTNYVWLGNQEGFNAHKMHLSNAGYVMVEFDEVNGDTMNCHIIVNEELLFKDHTVINVRDDYRKVVVVKNSGVVQAIADRGYVDGYLAKDIAVGNQTEIFEIGESDNYTPALLDFSGGGTASAGLVEAINITPLPNEPDNNPSYGHRMDPNKSIPRYWRIAPYDSSFAMGNRTLNVRLHFPNAELAFIDPSKSHVRRRSLPTENPEWSQRSYDAELQWDLVSDPAWVELKAATTPWAGIGEFYIGEKFHRAFYSINTGLWTDNLSWSFTGHEGEPCPVGAYPGHDVSEKEDYAEIGAPGGTYNHQITLDMPTVDMDTLIIQGNSGLDMQKNLINCYNCVANGNGYFRLFDDATLSLDSTFNADSNILTNFTVYDYNTPSSDNTTIRLYGTQTVSPDPFGKGRYYGNLHIDEIGTKIVNTAVWVGGNLIISDNAILEIDNIDALRIIKNVINSAHIENNGVIEIGE